MIAALHAASPVPAVLDHLAGMHAGLPRATRPGGRWSSSPGWAPG